MTCRDMQRLLHAYLDDELDLERSLEVESHLETCDPCGAEARSIRELRAAIAAHAPYHSAPRELRRRIVGLVPAPPRTAPAPWRTGGWLAACAAVSAAVLGVWTLAEFPARRTEANMEREVVASHYRSLLAGHLTDVESSDRHTVKPWFTGRLDYGADVFDLASSGFPLAGGRLDYIGGRTVAALVYNRGRHVINVFLWPREGIGMLPRADSTKGFHTQHWYAGGMEWWAVSDVNPADLEQLAKLLSAAEGREGPK